jgi:hypothetical protein
LAGNDLGAGGILYGILEVPIELVISKKGESLNPARLVIREYANHRGVGIDFAHKIGE